MKPVVIRGAGLIGSLVADTLLRMQIPVAIVTRQPKRFGERNALTVIDRSDEAAQIKALTEASCVINLEGRNIAADLWSKKVKNEILSSRVESVTHLAQILSKTDNPELAILQASATGYYGDRGDELLTETSDPGYGFLADTCVAWESAALKSFKKNRLALFRIAPVLSNRAGVFVIWRRFFRMYLGGRFGKGNQYFSWIHEYDMAQLLVRYAKSFSPGIINAAAPQSVTNLEITAVLSEKLQRPAKLPVPQFLLKGLPGGFGREMLLASVRAVPKRALDDGFEFRFETFERAVEDLR